MSDATRHRRWENLGTSHVDLQREPSRQRPLASALETLRSARSGLHIRRGSLVLWSSVTLVLLLSLVALLAVTAFSSLHLPPLLRSPRSHLLLAALVLFAALRTYTDSLLTIGFFGRFVRPGLRRLLAEMGDDLFHGEKLFRGRPTVIMKVDIVDFTKTTFEMPYGMRRLFVDLWFTLVDRVVAHQVFLDKSLGDGSVYYFESGLPGGSCQAALAAALTIRRDQVEEFDVTFRQRLCQRFSECPELARNAERYFRQYRDRTGHSFWARRTAIRIALATGYVDEGLWGLSSQSHYDAQGNLPILATRLENEAAGGEIVFDHGFLLALQAENPDLALRLSLRPRRAELKGIGEWQLYSVPALD